MMVDYLPIFDSVLSSQFAELDIAFPTLSSSVLPFGFVLIFLYSTTRQELM
jgi:hypothetical protein